MEHSLETQVKTRLARLRALDTEHGVDRDGAGGADGMAPVVPGQQIVPGVWFVADTEQGQMEGAFRSRPDILLQARFAVHRPGRWLSLNLALNGDALAPDEGIGVVLEVETAAPVRFGLRVRSGHGAAEFEDSPFPESHVTLPGRSTHVSLLRAKDAEALTRPALWRNLMLGFAQTSFEITLHDVHLFVARPAQG